MQMGSFMSRVAVLLDCLIASSTSGLARSSNWTRSRDQPRPRIPLRGAGPPSSRFVVRGFARDACLTQCISLTKCMHGAKSRFFNALARGARRRQVSCFPLRYVRRRRVPCLGMAKRRCSTNLDERFPQANTLEGRALVVAAIPEIVVGLLPTTCSWSRESDAAPGVIRRGGLRPYPSAPSGRCGG